VFGSIAVFVNRERHRELIPYVVAVISTVQMFFLYLMVVHKNPFTTFLTEVPVDGRGLNPLLQNYWMVIHPPSLYTGFVGMTIPYAFGMAALITGHLDDSWLRAVRRWTMFSWIFLSFGLTLGMIWPTRCSAGAASGVGIRSRMPACCRGSRRRRSCTR
jgi:cytochrome c-type biogenesis protein CcmF